MQLVSVWLRRQIAAGAVDQAPETAATRLVARYASAVVAGYRCAAPMADYAAALHVTPTHLTYSCRTCCGRTAAEILTERKLHAALCNPRAPRCARWRSHWASARRLTSRASSRATPDKARPPCAPLGAGQHRPGPEHRVSPAPEPQGAPDIS